MWRWGLSAVVGTGKGVCGGESVSPLSLAQGLMSHYASHCVFVVLWGINTAFLMFTHTHSSFFLHSNLQPEPSEQPDTAQVSALF